MYNIDLDRVRKLCVYTLLSATLDTSTDSNTRQRSTCHIDMLVANLGLLNLAADRAMVTHNTGTWTRNPQPLDFHELF